MSKSVELFSDVAISIAEKLRLADELPGDEIKNLYRLFDGICIKYEKERAIPKSLAFDVLSLIDSLEGAINIYSGEKRDNISEIESRVRMYIERLLLN